MTDTAPTHAPETPGPRSHRALPWLFTAAATVFLAVVAVTGSLPDPAWRWAVVGVGLVGAAASWWGRLPLPFALVFLLAAVRLGTARVLDSDQPAGGPWEVALNLVLGGTMCLLVLVAFQYRNGRLGTRDAVDVVAVVLGTGVVAWMAVAHPLIEDDLASPLHAILLAGYLPLASLLVMFTVDVAFSGLFGNRTTWFATAAATVHLLASWAFALHVVGTFPEVAGDLGVAGNATALCLLAAAMTHADAPRSLTPVDAEQAGSDTLVRVVIMGVSAIVPVSMVAAVAPSSTDDVIVRGTGIGLLVIAIVARLLIAIRQNRATREALLQQVTRDDLTRLPNRSRFIDEVAEVLESTWHSSHRATVVKLNLDRFKNINDSFGHYAANEVLIVVSERLRTVGREIDAVVARVGGDDFAMVQAGVSTPDEALAHAQAVLDALSTPIEIGDASVFVTASIGVALAPRNRTTAAEDLMRYADIAAHHAKQNGRNRIELFDESMQARLTRRMDVEHALHGAIGRKEMRLFYQPIVDIVSGRTSGFEALMRWERHDRGLVSPADFIPVAEETGIICELGAWALQDALGSLRRWIDDGLVGPSTTMSVNVSPRQVADPALPTIVRTAIATSGVPPHLLWLEITESMMLEEPELASHTLDEIRAMGVRIAMDDFGTGFSSLSVLQQFPIQRIKIDRAFVQGLGAGGNDRSLVRTIIAMARSMALDLVAEGVETVEQLEALRELGCDKAQGFLISRPVPADAMRSTVVALDEMASLSIFSPTMHAPDTVGEDEPVPARPARRSAQFATAGPLGPMTSRPLGGPTI
jgi:diguanylate cyclase (GGDEF)-like protein